MKCPLILFVTGDRLWRDAEYLTQALAGHPRGSWLIQGDASGADRIAATAGHRHGYQPVTLPACWAAEGNAAGPIRNRRMLHLLNVLRTTGHEIHCFVVHDDLAHSKGTRDMVKLLEGAEFPYTRVTHAGTEVLPHSG